MYNILYLVQYIIDVRRIKMLPYINFLGREIPMYGLMMMTGAFFAILFACMRGKKKGFYSIDLLLCSIFCFLGGLLGAKILYFITDIPRMIEYFKDFGFSFSFLFNRFLTGGIVFYGGLIGGFIGGFVYTKMFRLDFWRTADVLIPFLPLAHGFGRMGCFFAGCCYGREAAPPWGIIVNSELSSAMGTYRLPVQLYEAAFDFFILLPILLLYSRKPRKKAQVVGLYAILYGIFRFCNEYLRDDAIRGIFGAFSTSQWISIALVPIGIILMTGVVEKLFPNRLPEPGVTSTGIVLDPCDEEELCKPALTEDEIQESEAENEDDDCDQTADADDTQTPAEVAEESTGSADEEDSSEE